MLLSPILINLILIKITDIEDKSPSYTWHHIKIRTPSSVSLFPYESATSLDLRRQLHKLLKNMIRQELEYLRIESSNTNKFPFCSAFQLFSSTNCNYFLLRKGKLPEAHYDNGPSSNVLKILSFLKRYNPLYGTDTSCTLYLLLHKAFLPACRPQYMSLLA